MANIRLFTYTKYFGNALKLCYIVSFLCLITFFLFYSRFAFNYETHLHQQYTLILWLPILMFVLYGSLLTEVNLQIFIGFLIVLIIVCILSFSTFYSFNNEYFFNLSVIVLASYIVFILSDVKILFFLILIFITLFILQIGLGIIQHVKFNESNLLVSGSLENSGVYAYYLVSNLPFLYWICFQFVNESIAIHFRRVRIFPQVLFFLILMAVSYLVFLTQSRTAFICLITMIGYLFVERYKSKVRSIFQIIPKSVLIAVLTTSIFILYYVAKEIFNLKKLSALGRILNIEIAWQNIGDHFWFGTGLGRFTWYYPQWQANYFKTVKNPSLEYFFSADENYILFNEYLQLFCSIGVLGFLLFVYFIVCFFRLRSKRNSALLSATKLTVILILCSGFTSYPFHVTILLLLFGFCLAVGFVLSDKIQVSIKSWRKANRVFIILSVCLTTNLVYKGFQHYHAVTKWNNLYNKDDSFGNKEQTYKKIYSILNKDGKFLAEFGQFLLNDTSQKILALNVLEHAKYQLITRQSIESLILAYHNISDYDKAIQNQYFLTNYLPNKFSPKYDLLKLYAKKADSMNVKKIGRIIMEMPIKIQSIQIDLIKQNTHDTLKHYCDIEL